MHYIYIYYKLNKRDKRLLLLMLELCEPTTKRNIYYTYIHICNFNWYHLNG